MAKDEAQPVVARYVGGVILETELTREVQRLPLHLRSQFDGPYGRREFVQSMVDKRLLVAEAKRRNKHGDPELRRQVEELEERLLVQALLVDEEKAKGPLLEADQRAYFEANKELFRQPERVRAARILAAVRPDAPLIDRNRARARAEVFARRLSKGEPLAAVAKEGDGPERVRDGDLGALAKGELTRNPRLEHAAFAMEKPGAISAIIEELDGYSVLVLLERRPARVPPFNEVRGLVEGRMAPARQRRVLEDLLEKLRAESTIVLETAER